MKVLTIQEPCATAIRMKQKRYETRSWATKYRGPLLVHAGKTPWAVSKAWYEADELGIEPNFGNIIAKCNLVDCIKIDQAFINSLRDNSTELNLGLFEIGRYAWVLEDVEPLDPIPARGYNTLWNYEL